MISRQILAKCLPHATHTLLDGIYPTLSATLSEFGIKTPREIVDFLAQTSEESGGYVVLEENLHYSWQRARQVWPSLFHSTTQAQLVVSKGVEFFADYVYGSRNGNIKGTHDGYNFRGRGVIQLTGRANYERVGARSGLDLVNHPELVIVPHNLVRVAAAYWQLAGANKFADRGDFQAETRLINGGLVNYQTRVQWRNTWKSALGVSV